jgi:hypothetical protein
MKKYYTVLSPIRFDGKDYAVGSQIDLEDAEAEGLHEGAIDGTAKEITPLIAPTDEAERIAAVVAAIAQMDTGQYDRCAVRAYRLACHRSGSRCRLGNRCRSGLGRERLSELRHSG